MANGLWESKGKTSGATVSAQLYSDIKKKGRKSPFVKTGAQTFALRDTFKQKENTQATPPKDGQVPKTPYSNTGLSFTACAQKVLEEFGVKKPMHYKKITEQALEKGWLVTSGKTPEATMYAQVITEIKRQQKRGDRP